MSDEQQQEKIEENNGMQIDSKENSANGAEDRPKSSSRQRSGSKSRKHSRRRSRSRSADHHRRRHRRSRSRSGGRRSSRRRRSNSRERSRHRRSRRRSRSRSHGRSSRKRRSKSSTPEDPEARARREKLLQEEANTRDVRTIFVSQLQVRAKPRQIKLFFEQVGEVRDVRLITDKYTRRSKGFGYIEMAKIEDVPKALLLHGQKFCLKHDACNCSGFPISVKASEAEKNIIAREEKALKNADASSMAAPGAAVMPQQAMGIPSHPQYQQHQGVLTRPPMVPPVKVEVKSLPPPLNADDIRPLFAAFGTVVNIELTKYDPTGTNAMVEFDHPDPCMVCQRCLDGFTIAGNIISCKFAVSDNNNNNNNVINSNHNGMFVGGHPAAMVGNAASVVDNEANNWKLDDEGDVGLSMDSNRRAMLMARLAGQSTNNMPGSNASSNNILVPPSGTNITGASSDVNAMVPGTLSNAFKLSNMFNPATEVEVGWDIDIRDDVIEECSKWGKVLHCFVDRNSMGDVYLLFDSQESAKTAAKELHGRWFNNLQIQVSYMSISSYVSKNPDAQEVAARTIS